MKIQDITSLLEKNAPLHLQEEYDNAGLIIGSGSMECKGIMVALDTTPEVIREAKEKNCNLVIAHHPIVFRGLKKINGKNYVEEAVIMAIKNDIAIYAIHTNLDNVINGVNGKMADLLGLVNRKILVPKSGILQKLSVFVPHANKEKLLEALFSAGAGDIGNYRECSFTHDGLGTFKGKEGSTPFIGEVGMRHSEPESRIEVIFPVWLQGKVLQAMKSTHPYEEVAFEVYNIDNQYTNVGSGLIGNLIEPMSETEFLKKVSQIFNIPVIKHTQLREKPVQQVALCGGSGSFLTGAAIAAGADVYLTSDIKYHEFFDAGNSLVLADIGHYESEQYTQDLLVDLLRQNFPNFAVLKTTVHTNPVRYYKG